MRRYPPKRLDRKRAMLLYISCAVVWGFFTILNTKWRVPHWGALYYNNPLVLLASLGLFAFMSKLKIHSRLINMIASSVLAAYLIQDIQGGLIYHCADIYNKMVLYPSNSVLQKTALMVTFILLGSVSLLGLSFIIDRIRLLMMRPVYGLYGFISKRLGSWFNRISLNER